MYWPNGVPRVYAVNGPGVPAAAINEDRVERPDGVQEQDGELKDINASEALGEPPRDSKEWASESIQGLCVSRSGHLFVTMTETSIAVWQTKVCHVRAMVRK